MSDMAENGEKKTSFKVVVTGFGPFQGVPRNESWLAVSGLWSDPFPSEIKLVTRELAVVYDVVKREIPRLWDEEKPDLMIHVGVSKQDHQISLEKRAFNDNYELADIEDKCPDDKCCVKEEPAQTLESGLDVDKLCEFSNTTLRFFKSTAKCGPSTDPGRYLCGFTYFLSLHQDTSKSLFVHVPDEKLFSIEDMTLALRSIIFEALNQLYGYKTDSRYILGETIYV